MKTSRRPRIGKNFQNSNSSFTSRRKKNLMVKRIGTTKPLETDGDFLFCIKSLTVVPVDEKGFLDMQ